VTYDIGDETITVVVTQEELSEMQRLHQCVCAEVDTEGTIISVYLDDTPGDDLILAYPRDFLQEGLRVDGTYTLTFPKDDI